MKRILIIGNYTINSNDAVGITLRSFFDKEQFVVKDLYRLSKKQFIEAEYDSSKISSEIFPLEYFVRTQLKQEEKNDKLAFEEKETKNIMASVKEITKYTLESFVMFNQNVDLYKHIDDFSPDYIYTIGESVASLKLSYIISKKMKIPLVLHFMDNWIETSYSNNRLLKMSWNKLINKVVKHANKVILISEKMRQEFISKFALDNTFVLMNISEDYSKVMTKTNKSKNKITISYIGGIHLKRWESILEFAKNISEENNELYELEIYTNNPVSNHVFNEFSKYNVRIKEPVVHEKLVEVYNKTDILLHVESFDESVKKYTKYSFSTKITEYIFTKLPIIYFGPNDIAVAEYLESNRLAFSIENKRNINNVLIELTDKKIRKQIGEKSYSFGRKNLSKEKQTELVESIFL